MNLPLRWDAGWYLDIGVHGYRWSPAAEGQQNVAFFPAYPAYRLAREDLDDRSATSAVLLLCAFPFAVFYGAPYSESLFLLATVAAFFHARRGEWGVACVWGALAGLTRPNGFVPASRLRCWPSGLGPARRAPGWRLRRRAADWPRSRCTCWPIPAIRSPGSTPKPPGGAPSATWTCCLPSPWSSGPEKSLYNGTLGEPLRWLDGGAAILALALVVPLTRRLGWAYGSWIVVNLALAIGSGGLLSVGRVVSTLFPLFIYLGARLRPGQSVLAAAEFATLQGFGVALFYTWRPFI